MRRILRIRTRPLFLVGMDYGTVGLKQISYKYIKMINFKSPWLMQFLS